LQFVALLLFFAAIAKGYSGFHNHTFTWLLWTQIAIELVLAIWFASAIWIPAARRAALIAFSAFAAVSLFKILRQAPSCSCFGDIPVPPSAMFLLDLAMFAVLVMVKPHASHAVWRLRARLLAALGIIVAGLVTARLTGRTKQSAPAIVTKVADTDAGSLQPPAALIIQKTPVTDYVATTASATQWIAQLGNAPQNRTVTVLFPLTSPNHRLLHIRGVSTSCGCANIPDLPRSIPASGSADVVVKFRTPDHAVRFESDVMLTTDDPQLPPLRLTIVGGD
jgi:hypothetical protein